MYPKNEELTNLLEKAIDLNITVIDTNSKNHTITNRLLFLMVIHFRKVHKGDVPSFLYVGEEEYGEFRDQIPTHIKGMSIIDVPDDDYQKILKFLQDWNCFKFPLTHQYFILMRSTSNNVLLGTY